MLANREDADRLRRLPDPIAQLFGRDVNAALGHIVLGRGMLEDAGRVRLGLRPTSPLF